MPLTVAEGSQAGQYAAAINSLQTLVTQMTKAAASASTLSQVSLSFSSGATQIAANIPLPPADTITVLNQLIAMANALIAQYTAALQAMP
jgi:hypothetical protein